jgi:hypothetical protein
MSATRHARTLRAHVNSARRPRDATRTALKTFFHFFQCNKVPVLSAYWIEIEPKCRLFVDKLHSSTLALWVFVPIIAAGFRNAPAVGEFASTVMPLLDPGNTSIEIADCPLLFFVLWTRQRRSVRGL